MAISTYSELKTAVADWLHRSDLTSQVSTFVSLCEAKIARDLRCRAMEESATGTLSATTLAIPSGFLEVRRVILNDIVQEYVLPSVWYQMREETGQRYTILGTDFVFQSSSYTYQIDYYKAFTAFSSNSDTNWLLTNNPDVYLFGTLAEAATFIGKDPSMFQARYQDALQRVRNTERNAIGPLTVRVDTRNTP